MISFELTAIDLILALSVILLMILYMTKTPRESEEKNDDTNSIATDEEMVIPQTQFEYTKCPRGFGDIKKIGEDDTISEKCLGCYMIMECYTKTNSD